MSRNTPPHAPSIADVATLNAPAIHWTPPLTPVREGDQPNIYGHHCDIRGAAVATSRDERPMHTDCPGWWPRDRAGQSPDGWRCACSCHDAGHWPGWDDYMNEILDAD